MRLSITLALAELNADEATFQYRMRSVDTTVSVNIIHTMPHSAWERNQRPTYIHKEFDFPDDWVTTK